MREHVDVKQRSQERLEGRWDMAVRKTKICGRADIEGSNTNGFDVVTSGP